MYKYHKGFKAFVNPNPRPCCSQEDMSVSERGFCSIPMTLMSGSGLLTIWFSRSLWAASSMGAASADHQLSLSVNGCRTPIVYSGRWVAMWRL